MQHLLAPAAALFPDRDSAIEAIGELTRIGVPRDRIRGGMRNDRAHRSFVHEQGIGALQCAPIDAGLLSTFGRLTEVETARLDRTVTAELTRAGVAHEYARYFDEHLTDGCVLLLLPAESPGQALSVLAKVHADLGSGTLNTTIELRAERLTVRKELVVTGEVILRTEVISEIQRFEVELEREEMVIEYRRLGPDGAAVAPEITRIPIRHEEVVLDKRTIVTGEVVARKERFVEAREIDETVRHEVLTVETNRTDRVHDDVTSPGSR